MRIVPLALLVPSLVAAGGQGNEAEKLYRELEKRIASAKIVRVSSEAEIDTGGKEDAQFRTSLSLDEGDKGTVRATGKVMGKEVGLNIVSDGKKLKVTAPPDKEREQPLPKRFGMAARIGLSRVGLTAGLFMVQGGGPEEPDIEKLIRVSDFKLGGKATVQGREARVLQYKVVLGKEQLTTKVWLDAKTGVPLKREMSGLSGGLKGRIVESYSEFKLGTASEGQPSRKPSGAPK